MYLLVLNCLVMNKNRKARQLKKETDVDENLTPEQKLKQAQTSRKAQSKKASIFDEVHKQSTSDRNRIRHETILRQNEEKNYTVAGIFEKVKEMDEKLGDNILIADKSLIREYMKCGQDLWDDFGSINAFFPQSRVCILKQY